jgi:hypothetical protein
MGDMKMEGAVIAPDRSSMEMTVGGHEFGFIQIGSQSWTRSGSAGWEESPAPGEEMPGFSATDFCLCAEADSVLSRLQGKEETVNGIEAIHYHLDEADLTALEDIGCLTIEDVRDIPGEVDMDVWLAENGDWPVRLGYKASGEDEQGEPVGSDVLIELKDFNDSSIKIEPPE